MHPSVSSPRKEISTRKFYMKSGFSTILDQFICVFLTEVWIKSEQSTSLPALPFGRKQFAIFSIFNQDHVSVIGRRRRVFDDLDSTVWPSPIGHRLGSWFKRRERENSRSALYSSPCESTRQLETEKRLSQLSIWLLSLPLALKTCWSTILFQRMVIVIITSDWLLLLVHCSYSSVILPSIS